MPNEDTVIPVWKSGAGGELIALKDTGIDSSVCDQRFGILEAMNVPNFVQDTGGQHRADTWNAYQALWNLFQNDGNLTMDRFQLLLQKRDVLHQQLKLNTECRLSKCHTKGLSGCPQDFFGFRFAQMIATVFFEKSRGFSSLSAAISAGVG